MNIRFLHPWGEQNLLPFTQLEEGRGRLILVLLFYERKYSVRTVWHRNISSDLFYRNPTWVKVPHSLINNLHKSCLWLLSIAHNHFKPQLSHQCLPQLSWFGQNSSRQWNSGGNRAFARLSGNLMASLLRVSAGFLPQNGAVPIQVLRRQAKTTHSWWVSNRNLPPTLSPQTLQYSTIQYSKGAASTIQQHCLYRNFCSCGM